MSRYITSYRVNSTDAILDSLVKKEQRKRSKDIEDFYWHHALAELFKLVEAWIYAREVRNWQWMWQATWMFAHAFARLSEDEQERFADALPGHPSPHYPHGSDGAWCAYLCSLLAVPKRREALRERIRERITETHGADFIPENFDPEAFWGEPEPPF